MSGKVIQLDMFMTEVAQQKQLENEELKKVLSKSIRGLFARYNELEYVILEMHKKIERLESQAYANGL